jgi:aminoglycoside 6'-N-acetyltransferase I
MIINADTDNLNDLVALAALLFPDDDFDDLYDTYKKCLLSENEFGFLYKKDNKSAAYMHLSIRHDYVNGTDTSPVMFVEAVYVSEDYRKQGIGKEFIEYAEAYAREKGLSQLASDCFTDNAASENFHKSCGFTEKERVICFVKDI